MPKGKQAFSAKGAFEFVQGGKPFNMAPIEDVLKSSIEDLPAIVQRRVKALINNHKDYIALDKKYREEVNALDRKYQQLYAPLFLKRASVAKGDYEPTEEESRIEGEEPVTLDDKSEKDIKGIPDFWLTALKNNTVIAQTITPEDEKVLAYLQDIRCATLEGDKHGFVLTFHFAENPFFVDSVLTKTYYLAEDDNIYGELVFDRAEGTKINWKPGKNLTVKLVKQQQKSRGRGKKGGATRVTTVEEPCDSFFIFFTPPERDAEDEDEEAILDDLLEADFEEGCIFKDKLVPHSVLWFTGEAAEFDDYDDDFGYDGEFDDEDDEDDEEDEEDEEEEERHRKGGNNHSTKKGGPARAQLPAPTPKASAPAPPQQPECKQQ